MDEQAKIVKRIGKEDDPWMVTENWVLLGVIFLSWVVNYVQTPSCVMTGNWFEDMNSNSEKLTNFIENSRMRVEDPEKYNETCKENNIRLGAIRTNQFKVACYIILESLVLFLFINPMEFRSRDYEIFRKNKFE